MKIRNIQWAGATIVPIAKHGVDTQEVEEACFESNPFVLKTKFDRYVALGQTRGGRYLTVVLEYLGHNSAKIVTARAMSESERRLYKRR